MPELKRRSRVTASEAVVPSSIPGRARIFNFFLGLELGGMVEQVLNRWLPFSNTTGLNLKSLCSAYVVKAYIPLIAIRPLYGDAKPSDRLGAFR